MARPTTTLLIVCLASPSLAQESKDTSASRKLLVWLHDVFLQEVSSYDFSLGQNQKLEFQREPVMRLTGRPGQHGEVYVWTHQGASAVVGCVWSNPERDGRRDIMLELHSLSPGPLVAGPGGRIRWQPEEAGLDLMHVPDAPAAARTESLRLTQMRDMARGFSANIIDKQQHWELRLLPQPLYRYKPTDSSTVVDGALFAYVWNISTDPEVLLVIEAHRTDSGIAWRYAPARFTNRECWVNYRGREIWRSHQNAVGLFDGVTNKRYGAYYVKTVPIPVE